MNSGANLAQTGTLVSRWMRRGMLLIHWQASIVNVTVYYKQALTHIYGNDAFLRFSLSSPISCWRTKPICCLSSCIFLNSSCIFDSLTMNIFSSQLRPRTAVSNAVRKSSVLESELPSEPSPELLWLSRSLSASDMGLRGRRSLRLAETFLKLERMALRLAEFASVGVRRIERERTE